jgi:hypothetical protein
MQRNRIIRIKTVIKTGATIRSLAVLAAGFLAVCFLVPSLSSGETGQFAPRVLDYNGDLELGMTRIDSRTMYEGKSANSGETTMREKLHLSAVGYLYHPRFILLSTDFSGGLDQVSFERNGVSSRNVNSLREYGLRAKFLPEHPYNLELFALRFEPVTSSRYGPAVHSITDERGALFRYARKPLFLNLDAVDSSTTSGASSSDSRTYRASGTYLIGPTSNTASYSRSDSADSLGSRIAQDTYLFGNQFSLDPLFVTSRIEGNEQQQNSFAAPPMDTKGFSWSEQLQSDLPWRLRTTASYNLQRNTVTSGTMTGQAGTATSNKTDSMGLALSHRLYESLTTEIGMNRTSFQSMSGNTDSRSRHLSAFYTKKVPAGVLTASANLRNTLSDRNGAPLILQESHSAVISGDFSLNAQSVDITTISVWVKDPVTGSLILLTNTQYLVQFVGTSVRIVILALPATFTVGTVYEFLVSYAVVPADVELETANESYEVRASLLDNLVSPYYGRSFMTQKVLSGALPGGPDDSITDTAGIALLKGPFSFAGEYSRNRSQRSPSHSLRNSASYRAPLDPTLDLSANIGHERNTYEATEAVPVSNGYSERITAAGLLLNKRYQRAKLNISAGISYARRLSLIDSETFALNASLSWRIGKVTLLLSASDNHLETTTANGDQTASSAHYYLTVNRKLF